MKLSSHYLLQQPENFVSISSRIRMGFRTSEKNQKIVMLRRKLLLQV